MKENKIKFYVDPKSKIQNASYIPLLYPFWGVALDEKTPYNLKLFNKYNFDTDYYKIIDNIKESDFVLLPYRYTFLLKNNLAFFRDYLGRAQKENKPMLIDDTGDIEYNINHYNTYILRVGGYRHFKKKNEIHFPPYADDLLEEYYDGKLQIRGKKEIATIGFAGWAKLSFSQKWKARIKSFHLEFLGLFKKYYLARKKGVLWRIKANRVFEKSKLLKTNFLIRKSYSAFVGTAEKDMNILRREFVENMINSDYALCVRGDANSATRFYEALSLGRIPVVLDTDWIKPFDNMIDYSKFSIFIDFKDIEKMDEILADFHKNLSPEKFIEMQKNAREAFVKCFRVDNLTKILMSELLFKLKQLKNKT